MSKSAKILPILKKTDQPLHLCVSFVLLWIASCDGKIDDSEREYIFHHMKSTHHDEFNKLISIIEDQDFGSFIIVCKALQKQLDHSLRESFLILSIGVAIADQKIAISENHLLRFLADIMDYSSNQFAQLYMSVTGSRLIEPGDPSSMQWWNSKQKTNGKNERDSENNKQKRNSRDTTLSRDEAYVILGLQPGVSQDDIRRAYKRLMQVHHPDRFNSLGPEAAEAAHAMVVRIQKAYKVLSL